MIYRTTVEIAFDAECDASACDTMSEMFRHLEDQEVIRDWGYIRNGVTGEYAEPKELPVDPEKQYEESELLSENLI